ncbi:hypothetical protein BH11PSE9_BH11PSE9_17580 [soil metagenome]
MLETETAESPEILDIPPGSTREAEPTPRYRSGAVARMVRMPVATLRIWERRYHVTAPATTATGHRLYSGADVQRLALLKQLTDLGHAIGSVATLDMAALRQVAATHASTMATPRGATAATGAFAAPPPWRVAVVGAALARRLQHAAVLPQLGRALDVIGPFDDLAEAIHAARAAEPAHGAGSGPAPFDEAMPGDGEANSPALAQAPCEPTGSQADTLLVHIAGLHDGSLEDLQQAAKAFGARRIAVIYGFAAASASEALMAAGVSLLREPQGEAALGTWLRGLGEDAAAHLPKAPVPALSDAMLWAGAAAPPRRYDDATLSDFAGLSTTIACECPRHVAEILMQLSHFEAYSAECASRSVGDAALHAYLGQVAGAGRALFESALERLAIHEGLVLPD